MKKSNFWTGILAITLVFAMTAAGCDNDPADEDDSSGKQPQKAEYISTDADGYTYILTITENTSRAVYIAIAGDSYVLIIRKAGQPDKVSSGTISTISNGVLTLQPNKSDSDTFGVTIVSGQMTGITGTISVEQGNPVTAPGPVIPESGLETLTGDVTIIPSEGVTTGTELRAAYSGTETVGFQWNKDGTAVQGAATDKYTPTEAGTYTVSILS